jgi:predicted amidohydrolase YtcJ
MGWANSVTLTLAGITNLTDNPRGGTIMRTADGGEFLKYLGL